MGSAAPPEGLPGGELFPGECACPPGECAFLPEESPGWVESLAGRLGPGIWALGRASLGFG